MADVSIKLNLEEAKEVKKILKEILTTRQDILSSRETVLEYRRRENGPAELRSLQESTAILEGAIRKMA